MTELILQITVGLGSSQITYWPHNHAVGQGRGLLAQRRGRYVAGSAGHRDRTPPDLATALIHRYSSPGDLVCDPFAGTGTTLVEAVHANRNGLGLDIEPGWVSLARANLALAARQGATGWARVIHADATRLPARLPTALRGKVDLILTSPPIGRTMPAHRRGGHHTRTRAPVARSIGFLRIGRLPTSAGLAQVLAGCAALLHPGGLAVVAFSRGSAHRPILSGEASHVVPAGLRAGLAVVDYLLANHRGQLLTRYPGDDLTASPRAITGALLMLPATAAHDIVVFGKSDQSDPES